MSVSKAHRRIDLPKDTQVHYGQYGILSNDGDRVQCHICGKWYIFLAIHVWKTHNYLADEYREQFGLGYKTGLLSSDFSELKGDIAIRLIQSGTIHNPKTLNSKASRDVGRGKMKGRKLRAESVIKNLVSHPRLLWRTSKCIICGEEFGCWESGIGKIKTCGKPACHSKAISLAIKGRIFTPEHRAKLSESLKKYYTANPRVSKKQLLEVIDE